MISIHGSKLDQLVIGKFKTNIDAQETAMNARLNALLLEINVCYGDVDHPVPGQIDHRVS